MFLVNSFATICDRSIFQQPFVKAACALLIIGANARVLLKYRPIEYFYIDLYSGFACREMSFANRQSKNRNFHYSGNKRIRQKSEACMSFDDNYVVIIPSQALARMRE